MIRPVGALALLVALLPAPAVAQLPYITAPRGTLRIEFGGAFGPASEEYADGTRRAYGDPVASAALTAASSPMVADLERRLATILTAPTGGGSLGSLAADLQLQRNVGTIGLAVGVSRRLTVHAAIPIVSVRTEAHLVPDVSAATLGLNPALLGDPTNAGFLDAFQASLDAVATRLAAGDYDQSPELQALATTTIHDGAVLHDALAALLVDPASASAVLPLADSPDGLALLATVATYRDRLGGELGVAAPSTSLSLPAAPISEADFATLLTAPGGFDLATFDEQPLVGLGDIDLGATWQLTSHTSPAERRWFGAWLQGGVTLPTGTSPRPDRLRDAGTGDGQLDLHLGGIVDAGRGRLGIRASADWRRQFAGTREARVGTRDAFLLPASRLTMLRWDPGDVLTVTARPYWRLVDRLAITGSLTWFHRGADQWALASGATAPFGGDVSAMGDGTAARALRVGLGMSYAHDGTNRDGVRRMPVEAGLAVERTVQSGSGLVPAALTTRLWFRVYKRLW